MGNSVSHSTYLSVNADSNDGHHYSAKFEKEYFDQGQCRYAFKGVLKGRGPRNGDPCVTKVFKKQYARHYIEWAPDLAASKMAKGYADQFVSNYMPRIRNYLRDNQIEFLIPLIAKMCDINHFSVLGLLAIDKDTRYIKSNEYVAIEPYINGTYQKFNSNGGYEDGVHSLMTAFCHWTWNVSGHKYMVCDLQGVNSDKKYILTDPAVHSRDMEFGPTDMGVAGMEMVLGNHRCNALCRELGLNNPMTGVYVSPGPRSTTYTFQVTEQEMMKARRGKSDHFGFISATVDLNF